MSIYELSSKEVYDTYSGDISPEELIAQGRNQLAGRLRVESNLKERDAFYAADQILLEAQRAINSPAPKS